MFFTHRVRSSHLSLTQYKNCCNVCADLLTLLFYVQRMLWEINPALKMLAQNS